MITVLDLHRDEQGVWRVGQVDDTPRLPDPRLYPDVGSILHELGQDGWRVTLDRRSASANGSATITLMHDGTPPRAPVDVLQYRLGADPLPPQRKVLGATYVIGGPNWPGAVATEYASRLDQITRDAYDALAAIHTDTRLSDVGQAETAQQTVTTWTNYVSIETNAALQALQFDRERLDLAARVPDTPRPEDAALLAYVRDELQVRWSTMTDVEIEAAWSNALRAGDLTAVRIYRYYVGDTMRNRPPWNTPDNAGVFPYRRLSDLMAASDRALAGAERCETADLLKQVEMATLQVQGKAKSATTALQGVKYDREKGRVVTVHEAAAHRSAAF